MLLEVRGATLNYETDGDAANPTVLLWHGAGCTLRMWDHVIRHLEHSFHFVRFDVRGVGHSSPTADPDTEYCLPQYANDANDVLDAVGVATCHVWGMAWGSRAALAYCSLNSARVKSAAFFDLSIGAADVVAQQEQGRVARAKQQAAGMELQPLPPGWNQHQYPDEVPKALAAAGKFDLRAVVPGLNIPVLVATGDHDPNLTSSREFVDLAPNASLVVMQDVGHGSVLQRPDLTSEIYQEFVEHHV